MPKGKAQQNQTVSPLELAELNINKKLSIKELAILCDLDIQDAWRRNAASDLSKWYREGGRRKFVEGKPVVETITADKYKRRHFSHIHVHGKKRPKPYVSKTKRYFYDPLFWYNIVRTTVGPAWLGIRTLIEIAWHSLPLNFAIGAHAFFGFASLVFGLEVLFDTFLVLKALIAPKGWISKKASWLDRLKDILGKDNRPGRMLNAGVWFCVNLLGFVLTGGISIPVSSIVAVSVGLAGYIFDVGHAWKTRNLEIERLERIRAEALKLVALDTSPEQNWQKRADKLTEKIASVEADRFRVVLQTSLSLVGGASLFTAVALGVAGVATAALISPICCGLAAAFLLSGTMIAIYRRSLATAPVPQPASAENEEKNASTKAILNVSLESAPRPALLSRNQNSVDFQAKRTATLLKHNPSYSGRFQFSGKKPASQDAEHKLQHDKPARVPYRRMVSSGSD